MFSSFFPNPRLFFPATILWTALSMALWYGFARDLGARLSLGGLVGFPYPPVNADGASIAVETARNIWLYQYMIVAGAIFVGLVGWLLPHRWFRWSVGVSAILIFFIWFQVQLDVMINNWFGTFYNMIQQALGKPGAVTQEQDNDWFIAHRKGANQARFQLIRVRQSQLCGALLSWDAADPQSLESKGLSGKSPNSGRPSQK